MNRRYWCFLSYSHKDEAVARWLAQAIEGFRIPRQLINAPGRDGEAVPRFIRPVFRDRDELPASADLGATLREALEASRVLVVLCSPDSARSRWVEEEILSFKRLGRADRILAVIVRGKPNAGDSEQECFPNALRFLLLTDGTYDRSQIAEPIAADLRADSRHDVLLRVIAGVLGIAFDDLKQRHRARQKKQRMITGLLAALLLGAFAGLWSWKELEATRADAAARAKLAKQKLEAGQHLADQKRRNEARTLREQGRAALIEGDPVQALGPLLASLEKVPDDEEALLLTGGAAHETAGLQRVLRGHTAEIRRIAVSQNEAWLASVGLDGRVLVWDVATGVERYRLEGGASPVAEFAGAQFSPDGRFLLAIRDWQKPAVLLDLATGSRQETPDAAVMTWTAGNRLLLVRHAPNGQDGCLSPWWDPKTLQETAGPSMPLNSRVEGQFNQTGRSAVIAGRAADGNRWFWLELDSGKIIASGKAGSANAPGAPALSPDGTKLVILGEQGWELRSEDGKVVKLGAMVPFEEGSLLQRPVIPATIDFADEGRFLVSANQGATVTIWDADGKALRHLNTRGIVTLTTDPYRPRALLRCEDGGISVIGLPDGKLTGEFQDAIAGVSTGPLPGPAASSIVLSKKGMVAVAAKSTAIKLWSIHDLDKNSIPLSSKSALGITSTVWSSDGKRLLVTQNGGSVSVCDTARHEESAPWRINSTQGSSADGGLLLPDGKILVVDESGQPSLWLADGKADPSWPKANPAGAGGAAGLNHALERVALMARDPWLRGGLPPLRWGTNLVFAGRGDSAISVFDGKAFRRLAMPDGALLRDMASNGNILPAGDNRGALTIWGADPAKPARHLQCADHPLRRIVFSPNGATVAVLTDDAEAGLWSLIDGSHLQFWRVENTSAHDLCFLNGGQRLAVACADGQVRIFEQGASAAVQTLLDSQQPPPDRVLTMPPSGFMRDIKGATVLASSPDQHLFAIGFDHGSVIVESSRSLQPLLRVPCDSVSALAFSPTGDRLAVGTIHSLVLILPVKEVTKEEMRRVGKLLGRTTTLDR